LYVKKPQDGCWTDNFKNRPGKSHKDYDLYIATWNVLSLYRIGASRQLKSELEKYSINIAAVQEIRWKGTGVMDTGNFTMYYSKNIGNTFGTGFLVRKKYKHTVIGFEPINERLCILRVREKFNNTTMICAHVPTEEKMMKVRRPSMRNLIRSIT
jgi:hypothetical protein